jgi:hypothetical protein
MAFRIFRILRNIPEVFEVESDTYDNAVAKIANGEVQESESESDTYELVESWCSSCKAVTCICPYERED